MIVWQQGEDYVLMYSNFFLFPTIKEGQDILFCYTFHCQFFSFYTFTFHVYQI